MGVLVGLAEARLPGHAAAVRAYLDEARPRFVVRADPFETEALVDRMVHAESGRVGAIAATAIALVEVACWDLVGKALNVPVYRHAMAHGLNQAVTLLAPRRIILGGGVSLIGEDLWFAPIRHQLDINVFPPCEGRSRSSPQP